MGTADQGFGLGQGAQVEALRQKQQWGFPVIVVQIPAQLFAVPAQLPLQGTWLQMVIVGVHLHL